MLHQRLTPLGYSIWPCSPVYHEGEGGVSPPSPPVHLHVLVSEFGTPGSAHDGTARRVTSIDPRNAYRGRRGSATLEVCWILAPPMSPQVRPKKRVSSIFPGLLNTIFITIILLGGGPTTRVREQSYPRHLHLSLPDIKALT